MREIWKPVVGYEGLYEVSNAGNVCSFRGLKPRMLRPGAYTKQGHVSVALGRGNSRAVHRLVLEAFVGPRPGTMDILHRNGSAADNRLSNLHYGSRSDNNRDMALHGKRILGVEQLADFRVKRALGWKLQELAEHFGMCLSNAGYVARGKYYGHITSPSL